MINRVMSPGAYLYIAILSVLWGASFFFMKVALRDFTPVTIVFIRVAGSALVLWLYMGIKGEKPYLGKEHVLPFMIMGVLNNMLPFSLIVWGQQFVESSVASIINASSPLFSMVLAHYLTEEERMTPGRIAGVLLGISGVALLIGVDAIRMSEGRLSGQLAMIAASLCYALAAIYGRRFRGMRPVGVATGVLSSAALLSLPLMLLDGGVHNRGYSTSSISALLGLVFLSTSLAFVLYFKTLEKTGPTNLLLVTFLIPVSAIFLGVTVLGETLSWNSILGMVLIFAGLTVMDGRLLKKLQGLC